MKVLTKQHNRISLHKQACSFLIYKYKSKHTINYLIYIDVLPQIAKKQYECSTIVVNRPLYMYNNIVYQN